MSHLIYYDVITVRAEGVTRKEVLHHEGACGVGPVRQESPVAKTKSEFTTRFSNGLLRPVNTIFNIP